MKILEVVFENDEFIVMVKPQNIPIQKDRQHTMSMLDYLENYFEFEKGIEDPFIGLVHRLDRHTGGLCIFAKTPKALKNLNALFANRKTEKLYLALVSGKPSESGHLAHFLSSDTKSNFVNVSDTPQTGAQEASLTYRLLCTKSTEFGEISLLTVKLHTGRQHQIRAQFSHIGYPIVGDAKYGTTPIPNESLALWSYSLKFEKYEFKKLPNETAVRNAYFDLFEDEIKAL